MKTTKHTETVHGRNGGISSAITREGSRLNVALNAALDADFAEIDALVASGMSYDEASAQQRRNRNARVLAEMQAKK